MALRYLKEQVLGQNLMFQNCPIHANVIYKLKEPRACENCSVAITSETAWKWYTVVENIGCYVPTCQLCERCFDEINEWNKQYATTRYFLREEIEPVLMPRDLYQIILEYLYTPTIKCPFH